VQNLRTTVSGSSHSINMCPLAHANDEKLDLEIGWRLPPAKHLGIRFWAFLILYRGTLRALEQLMMSFIYSPFPLQIVGPITTP